ncbi:hypothetical protein GJAV_G00091330 [Gymnothorax javanicus]|nr:hypothetical protein GJAV_G00091330 [Gymnothorax javanicus]
MSQRGRRRNCLTRRQLRKSRSRGCSYSGKEQVFASVNILFPTQSAAVTSLSSVNSELWTRFVDLSLQKGRCKNKLSWLLQYLNGCGARFVCTMKSHSLTATYCSWRKHLA